MIEKLTNQRTAALAAEAAAAFNAREAYPLREALALLRRWDLTGSQAAEVIAHGMAHRLFVLDPRDATLRPPRRTAARWARDALSALAARAGAGARDRR